jgi:cysteine-rich repeat protein
LKNLVLVLAALAGCGGSSSKSVCGNGKVEPGEDCDNGPQNGQPGNGCSADCTFVDIHNTSLQVTWKINYQAAPGFTDEPCFTVTDQGYQGYARVTLSGPVNYTDEYKCDDVSHTYIDQPSKPIPAGMYMVTVRLIEHALPPATDTMDLTSDVSTPMAVPVASMMMANVQLNFTYDKFLNQNRMGNLFFETTGWRQPGDPDGGTDAGGPVLMGCSAANVIKVRFHLMRMGQPVSAMTTTGLALDGSPTDCHTPSGPTDSYHVMNLPWGPYEMVVGGYTNGGATQLAYCETIPIFVGAGGANPTYQLVTLASSASSCP